VCVCVCVCVGSLSGSVGNLYAISPLPVLVVGDNIKNVPYVLRANSKILLEQ
jgi:hypothetical protein